MLQSADMPRDLKFMQVARVVIMAMLVGYGWLCVALHLDAPAICTTELADDGPCVLLGKHMSGIYSAKLLMNAARWQTLGPEGIWDRGVGFWLP